MITSLSSQRRLGSSSFNANDLRLVFVLRGESLEILSQGNKITRICLILKNLDSSLRWNDIFGTL